MQPSQYVVALACRTTYVACASAHRCTVCANAPSLDSIAIEVSAIQQSAYKALF